MQSVEAKKTDLKKLGVKDVLKGRKEKSSENSRVKTGRSKKITEKKEKNKRRSNTNEESAVSVI